MGKIKQILFILAAAAFLTACSGQHPDSYQGPAAPQRQDLPPPTNLLNE